MNMRAGKVKENASHAAASSVAKSQSRREPVSEIAGSQSADLVQRRGKEIPVKTRPAVKPWSSAPIQRVIDVQNVDYDPVTANYRHGHIHQVNFYAAVSALLNAAPFMAGHGHVRAAVCNAVAQNNYQLADIEALTTAISAAITTEYTNLGRPITAPAYQLALVNGVRAALVANIQPHALAGLNMNPAEGGAFDVLAGRPGVVMSRSKGVASQIPHGSLPPAEQGEVVARLNELRNERNALTAATLTQGDYFPNVFSAGVVGRQRGLHYQGNHTNNAGWLPAVAAPQDDVSVAANALLADAGPRLAACLNDANGPTLLTESTNEAARLRQEFRVKRIRHFNLTDAQVRDSALAALCQGISGYIEFSLGGPISRMMYDAVNHRVYVTAHYKWRQGYNPFFQVNAFPAL